MYIFFFCCEDSLIFVPVPSFCNRKAASSEPSHPRAGEVGWCEAAKNVARKEKCLPFGFLVFCISSFGEYFCLLVAKSHCWLVSYSLKLQERYLW